MNQSNDAAQPYVTRRDENHVAWLTLNAPKKMNALSRAMLAALGAELDAIGNDENIRVVVINGAGIAFSAGHDLKELLADAKAGNREDIDADITSASEVMLKIRALPQPVIAMVGGIAAAAGCQLVAACDLAVASTHARFATSGINLGLFCATPLVELSRSIGKAQALEMLFTGRFVDAEDALRIGLVNKTAGPEVLEAEVENLALEIASKSPHAIRLGKELYYRQLGLPVEQAYKMAIETMNTNINREETIEGISAFVEKRAMPDWGPERRKK